MKLELWKPLIGLDRGREGLFSPPRQRHGDGASFRPSIDVSRDEGELIIAAELPGVDPESDLEITLGDAYLTIKGEKTQDRDLTEVDRYVRERRYGRFVRRVPVPEGVSADDIEAGYDKGVLTIKVSLRRDAAGSEPETVRASPEGA